MPSFTSHFHFKSSSSGSTVDQSNTATFDWSNASSGSSTTPQHPASTISYCLFKDQLLSLTGSIIYLSALPALVLAARVTQRHGRKPTMWAIATLLAAGAATGAAAQGLVAVFASRVLLGMAMGCRWAVLTVF